MRHTRIFTSTLAVCSTLALSAAAGQLAPANVPAANAPVHPNAAPPGQGLGAGMYAAHVYSDASLANGVGATGAIRLGAGVYEVDFNRDVSTCFYTASSFGGTVAYEVEPRSGNSNGVFLEFSTLGSTTVDPATQDSEFYLQVYCGS